MLHRPSHSNTESAQWNGDFLLESQAALEGPAVDLMLSASDSYQRETSKCAILWAAICSPDRLSNNKRAGSSRVPYTYQSHWDCYSYLFVITKGNRSAYTVFRRIRRRGEWNGEISHCISEKTPLEFDNTLGKAASGVSWLSAAMTLLLTLLREIRHIWSTPACDFLQRGPDIPAPRPHSLLVFWPFHVISMLHTQDVTLATVWHSLSYKAKASI